MDHIRSDTVRAEPVYEYSRTGFLIAGPHLAQPGWYQLISSGTMFPSEEAPDNVRSRQHYERAERVRRRERLAGAMRGGFVGRNRTGRPFVRG